MPTLFCPNSKVSLGWVTVGLLLLFGQHTHAGCHICAPETILLVQPIISLFSKWCSCLAQSWSSSWALIPKSEVFILVFLWNFVFLFFFFLIDKHSISILGAEISTLDPFLSLISANLWSDCLVLVISWHVTQEQTPQMWLVRWAKLLSVSLVFSFRIPHCNHKGYAGGSVGKQSTCNTGDTGLIPGWEDVPEKEMATYSSILAWDTPCTEEPGRLQSMGLQRLGNNWVTKHVLL